VSCGEGGVHFDSDSSTYIVEIRCVALVAERAAARWRALSTDGLFRPRGALR